MDAETQPAGRGFRVASSAKPMTERRMSAAEINVCVGQRMRALRKARGLTLKQVGDAVGLRAQQIQKYEVAKNSMTVSRLVEFANCLCVTPAEMLSELPDEEHS